MWLTLGHIAPGSRELHHWVYQILATLLILGLWVALAGYAERRRSVRSGSDPVDTDLSCADARTGPESRRYVSRRAGRERRSPTHRGFRR